MWALEFLKPVGLFFLNIKMCVWRVCVCVCVCVWRVCVCVHGVCVWRVCVWRVYVCVWRVCVYVCVYVCVARVAHEKDLLAISQ